MLSMAEKKRLNKDTLTIAEHHFKTTDGFHTLYVQEWGNPKGVPVLYVHGGPGSGCSDKSKAIFNPNIHRVVLLDQRGAGNSTPYGSLKENTTQKLIEDIELVREKLEIDKWHLYGTSWGSTLSLCYGIAHTDRVASMIIGGVFLGSQEEVDWIEKAQFRTFFPEIEEEKEITPYTYLKLAMPTLRLDDRYSVPDEEDLDKVPLEIELHYTKNDCFLPKNHIIDNSSSLTMPIDIVQGRYDMMTPPVSAYKLYKKLSDSRIHWTIAGHSPGDRANYDITKALLSQLT